MDYTREISYGSSTYLFKIGLSRQGLLATIQHMMYGVKTQMEKV